MLTLFLSGGMTGLTREEMTEWRNEIKECAKFYDMKVYSPTDFFMGDYKFANEDKESFVYDTSLLRKSDVLIVNMNAPNSIGTAQEVMLAYEYNKPIIMIASKDKWGEVSPWLKHEATTVLFYEDYDDEYDLYDDVIDYAAMYE